MPWKKVHQAVTEFGECVMFHKTLSKKHGEKLVPRWGRGIYLGVNESSQELIIGTALGGSQSE